MLCHLLAKALADRAPRRLPSSAPGCPHRCALPLSASYFSLDTFGGKLLETENSRGILPYGRMRRQPRSEGPHAEHMPPEYQTGSDHCGRHRAICYVASIGNFGPETLSCE
jgi:hypothetical protein